MRLVANALAMMQGSAWCGAVSGLIECTRVGVFLLSACLPPRAFHLGVELDAHNQVLAALAVTLAVSAAILSAQRWCLEKCRLLMVPCCMT